MINSAVRLSAFRLLDSRGHLPPQKQLQWLLYFFADNTQWKHHIIEQKLTRAEAIQLMKEYHAGKS